MRLKSMKTVGLTAALMLTASASAMAAKLSLDGGSFAVPIVTGPSVAQESFGTQDLGQAAPQAVQNVIIFPSVVGAFTQAQMVVEFTIAGATFKDALTSTSLIGNGCVPNINLSSGGGAGQSTVRFLVDTAQACTDLTLNLGRLNSPTGDVTVTAKLENNTNLPVDNGITNNPITYVKLVNGLTAAVDTPFNFDIELAGGGLQITGNAPKQAADPGIQFVGSEATITVPANLAFAADMVTPFGLPAGTTGTVTIGNLPAATTAVVLVEGAAGNDYTAVALGGASCALTLPTATCTLNDVAVAAWQANPNGIQVNVELDGTTVLAPSGITATASLAYPATFASPDNLFSNAAIANIGTGACVAEFASMLNSSTSVSTIRLSNVSGTPAKVYVAATNDTGTGSAAVRVTKANVPTTTALDANDLLPAGSTIEILGSQVATATGIDFTSWSGVTRGRVRVFAETKGGVSGASAANIGAGQGCTAEGFVCVNGTCSITHPTMGGKDGQPIAAQNK